MEEFAKGLARGTLEWTSDKVVELAKRLVNRELAFIGREDYVDEAKGVASSGEFEFYKTYVKDRKLRVLSKMGLLLRTWENDPIRLRDLNDLRNKIRKKYADEGLHIAEIVQSRILSGLIPIALESTQSNNRAAEQIEAFLSSSVQTCVFIQSSYTPGVLANDLASYMRMQKPPLLVLFARGLESKRVCTEVVRTLEVNVRTYSWQAKDFSRSLIVFFVRTGL